MSRWLHQRIQNGKATLLGGAGEDTLYASSYSTAELFGGDGNDSLRTSSCGVMVLRMPAFGEDGDDSLRAYVDGYNSYYTDGDSSLNQSALLDGGEGNDTLYASVRIICFLWKLICYEQWRFW